MKPMMMLVACVAVMLVVAVAMAAQKPAAKADDKAPSKAESAAGNLAFTMKDIDGKDVDLAKKYAGQVVMVVNVASKCGLTPQYAQLQALHEKYQGKGLRVLGFPANNFKGQEPGSDEDIKKFCETKYKVSFDLFSKISVKDADKHPLYVQLTKGDGHKEWAGEISWNFEKILVGRDGRIVARFSPKVKPDAEDVTKAIEKALAEPAPAKKADDSDAKKKA